MSCVFPELVFLVQSFNRFPCLGLLGFQPIALGSQRGGTSSVHDMHGVFERAFHEAFRIASSGRPGPCHIDLPKEYVDEMQPALAQPLLSHLYSLLEKVCSVM